ncbi:MAG TPA: hypothetical protein VH165_27950 [Kofleriaceae bacterium]|nr:hypothetical protein [Kofleriaceae bacterium]
MWINPDSMRGMAQWSAVVCLATAGCAYEPGSFVWGKDTFPGQRASVGCLDIAIDRRSDLPIGPVLGYQFANRCDHALAVDLGAVAVVGRNAAGIRVGLAPYDPRHEVHPVLLDASSVGTEALAYPAAQALELCVDVSSFVGPGQALWRCFAPVPEPVLSSASDPPARSSSSAGARASTGARASAARPTLTATEQLNPAHGRSPFAVPIIVQRTPQRMPQRTP